MTDLFNYDDFGSTTGLTLTNLAQVVGSDIQLAEIGVDYEPNAVFLKEKDYYDEDWSLFFRIEIDPDFTYLDVPADGFAIVWAQSDEFIGAVGGAVGYFNADLSTGGNCADTRAVAFREYVYKDVIWSIDGDFTDRNGEGTWSHIGDYRYWLDYDSTDKTLAIYRATSDTKPDSPVLTFSDVEFGPGAYNLGITAATGLGTMGCRLKGWSLDGSGGIGWGITL